MMKMLSAALGVAALLSPYSFGVDQRPSVAPRFTGDQFVAQFLATPYTPKAERDIPRISRQRYAEGYLDGVLDATQGRSWCATDRMRPGELDERVWTGLKNRVGAVPVSAASALIEQFNSRLPCGTKPRQEIPPRLTGSQFVVQLTATPGKPRSDEDIATRLRQLYAEGYLDAVVDSTQGRNWCAPRHMLPGEVDDRALAGLKEHSGSLAGAAASALIEQFNSMFPCDNEK